jgi:hypothetical protein
MNHLYSNKPPKLNVTVGQRVVWVDYGTGRYEARPSFNWTVTRVTPSGKFELTADHNTPASLVVRAFNAQGFQLEGGLTGRVAKYSNVRICTDVAEWEAIAAKRVRAQVAAEAVNAVKLPEPARYTGGKDGLQRQVAELEALLALARAAVEAM